MAFWYIHKIFFQNDDWWQLFRRHEFETFTNLHTLILICIMLFLQYWLLATIFCLPTAGQMRLWQEFCVDQSYIAWSRNLGVSLLARRDSRECTISLHGVLMRKSRNGHPYSFVSFCGVETKNYITELQRLLWWMISLLAGTIGLCAIPELKSSNSCDWQFIPIPGVPKC